MKASPKVTREKKSSLIHGVAGASAGMITTAVLHPLDLIKIRLQGRQPLMPRRALILFDHLTLINALDNNVDPAKLSAVHDGSPRMGVPAYRGFIEDIIEPHCFSCSSQPICSSRCQEAPKNNNTTTIR